MAVSETRRRLRPLQCMAYSLSSLFIFSVWHGRYTRSCNLHPWHGRRDDTKQTKEVIYGSTVIYAVRLSSLCSAVSRSLLNLYNSLLLCSLSSLFIFYGMVLTWSTTRSPEIYSVYFTVTWSTTRNK